MNHNLQLTINTVTRPNSRLLQAYVSAMDEPDLSHFKAIPWCSALISNPAYKTTNTFSRQPKPSTEDSLIALTLSSPSTIKNCLSLYKPAIPPSSFIEEVTTLLTLGDGMNGGPNMLHGGIVATLMDDVMGTLLTVNKDQGGLPLTQSTVTASLTVKYLNVIKTPGTVAVVARCRKKEGRKFWLDAEVRDGNGGVLAKGEAVWIKLGKQGGVKEIGKL
jgi:acyl-coenzyme A thioesterase PaaI-like protein